MSSGRTLTEACKAIGQSRMTVWRWRMADKAFDADYCEARKAMAEALADDALTTLKALSESGAGASKERVQAAAAYSQRTSWFASKFLPKLYGDAPAQVNIDNRTVNVVLTDERRAELQERLRKLQVQDSGQQSSQDSGRG